MLPNITIPHQTQKEIFAQLDAFMNDEKVEFPDRIDNLWKFQLETVQQYGHEGIMVVLDYNTQVYVDAGQKKSMEIFHYSEAPESFPWHSLNMLAVSEVIRKVWEAWPIGFVASLEAHCMDLFALHNGEHWFLVYAYKRKDYRDVESIDFMAGRAPEPDARLSEELIRAGWRMPQDLKAFYAVHGNFGDISSAVRNDDTDCIASAETLDASLTFLEQYVEEWEVEYSFFDLLPFWEDGAGNSQNFYKAMPTEDSYMTVDWDHETKEISDGSTLAGFIGWHFGEKIEGI